MKKACFVVLCVWLVLGSCKPAYQKENLSFRGTGRGPGFTDDTEEKVSQMTHESSAIERLVCRNTTGGMSACIGLPLVQAWKPPFFPVAIGMAAMWDKEMMFRIATAVSDEARAKHHTLRQGKRGICTVA